MPNENKDFWPELNASSVVTPAAILKAQAAALTRKTNGLLEGVVESMAAGFWIYHHFFITVPSLDGYRYELLAIQHKSPMLYPVIVTSAPVMPNEEGSTIQHPNIVIRALANSRQNELHDQQEFEEWLQRAFSSAKTKEILESLLAQAA